MNRECQEASSSLELLHYTRWKLREEHIGREFCTSWNISHYWKQKLRKAWVEDSPELPDIFIGETSLTDLLKHGKYAAELLKELVFEEVRGARFSDHPSRKRCLFAFSTQLDPRAYRSAIGFKGQDRILIRIQALDGALIHFGSMEHLDCNLSDYEELTQRAAEYWAGCEPADLRAEALLEGRFRVLEIVHRGESSPA